MSINNRAYTNKFSIKMAMWDQDFIDMETEGHFTFEKDEIEYFQRAVRLR